MLSKIRERLCRDPLPSAAARAKGCTRRWFRDRDRRVEIEKRRAIGDLNSRGLASSGAWLQAMAIKQQDALHDYRDEMSAKRPRYHELREAEGKPHELIRKRRSKSMRRFELTDEQRAPSWPRGAPTSGPRTCRTTIRQ